MRIWQLLRPASMILAGLWLGQLAPHVQSQEPGSLPAGRFQLSSGTFSAFGGSAPDRNPIVMKIDTSTGATWTYVGVHSHNGKYSEGWAPTRALADGSN